MEAFENSNQSAITLQHWYVKRVGEVWYIGRDEKPKHPPIQGQVQKSIVLSGTVTFLRLVRIGTQFATFRTCSSLVLSAISFGLLPFL